MSNQHTSDIWWRDDDATEPTTALDRLLALKQKLNVPLALAVVPATAKPGLFKKLRGAQDLDLLVHGYAHTNHAPPSDRKAEFGAHRPQSVMRSELRSGLELLSAADPRTLPVLVPPWNRIDPALLLILPNLGFKGLSAWNDKPASVAGLVVANAHIDILQWGGGASAKSAATLADQLRAKVAERSAALPPVPIGVISHHLQMNDAAFEALETLLTEVCAGGNFHWRSARHIFGVAG